MQSCLLNFLMEIGIKGLLVIDGQFPRDSGNSSKRTPRRVRSKGVRASQFWWGSAGSSWGIRNDRDSPSHQASS